MYIYLKFKLTLYWLKYSSGANRHVHMPIYSHKKSHQHAFFTLIRFEIFLKSCILTYNNVHFTSLFRTTLLFGLLEYLWTCESILGIISKSKDWLTWKIKQIGWFVKIWLLGCKAGFVNSYTYCCIVQVQTKAFNGY